MTAPFAKRYDITYHAAAQILSRLTQARNKRDECSDLDRFAIGFWQGQAEALSQVLALFDIDA